MTLSIAQIFNNAELQQLESQGTTLSQEFILAAPVDKVWAVVSDNDLLRQKLGLSLVDFTYHPVVEGGSLLEGEFPVPLGKAHFFEKPYEWVSGSYSFGVRLFDKGPCRYLSLGFYLKEIDAHHTQVNALMKMVMKGPLKRILLHKMRRAATNLPAAIRELVQQVQSEKPLSFETSMRSTPHPEKLQRFKSALKRLEPFHQQIAAISDYGARASERFLQRLRPYALADFYKLSRQETLAFFLEGTQLGLFSLNWDILCPACRGAKKQSKSLRELDRKVHCEACGINFEVIDSQDVELTFIFAGELAVPVAPIYCIGNPGRSPDIHVQMPFSPFEKREIILHLPGQSYRLRDMKEGHLVRLNVQAHGLKQLSQAIINNARTANKVLEVQSLVNLQWDNSCDHWQVLRFDCLDPHLDAATADQVACLPAYQHLFGDDALRPGMQLGVGNLVFLFSDIRGSTQLYRELGDPKAFRVVQDHFSVMEKFISKEQGTIVKTIGDAVMASFLSEQSAISAALAIQKHYGQLHQGHQLQGLKIAVHSGSCIMVNLNDRMDYFGTTVNICSRLLDLAADEDIIVSGSLFQMPKVQSYLAQQDVSWTQDERVLRGFQEARVFYRLKLGKPTPLRLIS